MSKIAKGVWIGAGIAAIGAAAVVSHKITKYMMQVALDRDLPKVKNMEKSSQKMLGAGVAAEAQQRGDGILTRLGRP